MTCKNAQKMKASALKEGDILLVRAGWMVGYQELDDKAKLDFSFETPTSHVGLKTSVKTLEWLWERGFSACASDTPGWERWPALLGEGEVGGIGRLRLHEVMLNGWGMPIGELPVLPASMTSRGVLAH